MIQKMDGFIAFWKKIKLTFKLSLTILLFDLIIIFQNVQTEPIKHLNRII